MRRYLSDRSLRQETQLAESPPPFDKDSEESPQEEQCLIEGRVNKEHSYLSEGLCLLMGMILVILQSEFSGEMLITVKTVERR